MLMTNINHIIKYIKDIYQIYQWNIQNISMKYIQKINEKPWHKDHSGLRYPSHPCQEGPESELYFFTQWCLKIDDHYGDDDNVNDLIYCYRARYHPDGKTSTLNWRPEHQDTMWGGSIVIGICICQTWLFGNLAHRCTIFLWLSGPI